MKKIFLMVLVFMFVLGSVNITVAQTADQAKPTEEQYRQKAEIAQKLREDGTLDRIEKQRQEYFQKYKGTFLPQLKTEDINSPEGKAIKKHILLIIIGTAGTLFLMVYAWLGTDIGVFFPGTYSGETPGIYILSTTSRVVCLSDDFKILTTIDLLGSSDLTYGGNGKVYATIDGNSRKGGREIDVLQNGKLQKRIKLTYSLPWKAQYNPYNNKLYVSHKCKITNHKENCITVIDTITDEEETNIMYNYGIEDMAFTSDNKMIASAWEVIEDDRYLTVFDLKTNQIIKTMAMGDLEISSLAVGSDGLIYGVTQLKDNPVLYVIDWRKEEINKVGLSCPYPFQVYLHSQDKKEYVYISHVNENNLREGHMISVVDPLLQKVVDELDTVICPHSVLFYDDQLMVGNCQNNKVNILEEKTLTKSLDIEWPIDMVALPK
ncbi:MAG: YncE family protein [Syntrophomonadaceae bacterium]|jgi:hypothetical protein